MKDNAPQGLFYLRFSNESCGAGAIEKKTVGWKGGAAVIHMAGREKENEMRQISCKPTADS